MSDKTYSRANACEARESAAYEPLARRGLTEAITEGLAQRYPREREYPTILLY